MKKYGEKVPSVVLHKRLLFLKNCQKRELDRHLNGKVRILKRAEMIFADGILKIRFDFWNLREKLMEIGTFCFSNEKFFFSQEDPKNGS